MAFVALARFFAGSSEANSVGDGRAINPESSEMFEGLGLEVGEGVKPTEYRLASLLSVLFG